MLQFLMFVTVLALVGAIFYAKSAALPRKAKWILFLILGHVIGFGWLYELNNSHQSEQNREILSAFKQGKTLTCKEVEVNNKTFIYVSGTLSFIPKDTNEKHKGVVLDIVTCKLK